MKTIKLSPSLLREILSDDSEFGKVVFEEITGTSRWSTYHTMVFLYSDGKYYEAKYSQGATEMQDEKPWQYEKEVTCKEVKPVEKTVIVYEVVQ